LLPQDEEVSHHRLASSSALKRRRDGCYENRIADDNYNRVIPPVCCGRADLCAAIGPSEYSFRKHREALRQLGADSEIALMVWDYDVALAQPMTTDHNLIADKLEDRNKLRNILRPMAMTSEGDRAEFARPGEAIYQAARYLDKTASPGRRKIIIVIAHASWLDKWWHRRAAAEVDEMLDKTRTTVYGLYQDFVPGDVAEFRRLNRKDKERSRGGAIEEFVEQTGGSILIGKPEESDGLLIKLVGLVRSGKPSPELSAIEQKSSLPH
jgi:hypothetical protein